MTKEQEKEWELEFEKKYGLSEEKKFELLKNAVLKNDIDTVKSLYRHYEFEITAEAVALGLAMRFCGPQMVSALLEHGATLDYDAAEFRWLGIVAALYPPMDFGCLIFPRYPGPWVPEYDSGHAYVKGKHIISDEERIQSLKLLHDKKVKWFSDLSEVLYRAILYDDNAIYEALREWGICKISKLGEDIVSGRIRPQSDERREFFNYALAMTKDSVEQMTRILGRLLEHSDADKLSLFPSEFCIRASFFHSPRFDEWFCSEAVFPFFMRHTNMLDKVKKWDLLFALVDQNNAEGLRLALDENWISRPKDMEKLLAYAQEKIERVRPDLIGYILEKQHQITSGKAKRKSADSELSLD